MAIAHPLSPALHKHSIVASSPEIAMWNQMKPFWIADKGYLHCKVYTIEQVAICCNLFVCHEWALICTCKSIQYRPNITKFMQSDLQQVIALIFTLHRALDLPSDSVGASTDWLTVAAADAYTLGERPWEALCNHYTVSSSHTLLPSHLFHIAYTWEHSSLVWKKLLVILASHKRWRWLIKSICLSAISV